MQFTVETEYVSLQSSVKIKMHLLLILANWTASFLSTQLEWTC